MKRVERSLSYNRFVEKAAKQNSAAHRTWDGFLRETIPPLAPEEVQSFANKRILITGAGGFLGSALARALEGLHVSRLVLLDTAEYGLYRLEQELRSARTSQVSLVVGSVRDEALLRELFAEHAPQMIFHAAALKHVPLMERNEIAAAETNVLGTQAIVQEAAKRQVESFVLLSTDKAVEPISIMGATKRLAEQIALSARRRHAAFRAVRLCNVLGSTGSVAPLFARQISDGGPVTVTHPEATRYFLSQSDAVRHLLRSAITRSATGLSVPVVGPPVRVEDLATYMVRQRPQATKALRIVYTGLRVADKLHEQLVSPTESAESLQDDPSTLAVHSHVDPTVLEQALAEIHLAVSKRDRVRLIQAIRRAVPEYVPAQAAAHPEAGLCR